MNIPIYKGFKLTIYRRKNKVANQHKNLALLIQKTMNSSNIIFTYQTDKDYGEK